jgi:hypothetical protein
MGFLLRFVGKTVGGIVLSYVTREVLEFAKNKLEEQARKRQPPPDDQPDTPSK